MVRFARTIGYRGTKKFPVAFNQNYTGVMIDEFKDVSKWSKRVKILFMVNENNIDSVKKQ